MKRRLILDLSRMLSRARYPVPTGIDRVELAYAEGLLARDPDRLRFGAMHPIGQFAHLSRPGARRFLEMTARRWRGHAEEGDAVLSAARRLQNSILLRSQIPSRARLLGRQDGQSAYIIVSHHHLDRPAVIEGVKQRDRAIFMPLLHDLIPIEYPEYSRPGESERHQRRVENLARLADAVVVNSEATRRSLQPWLDRAGRNPPVLVAPLGVDLPLPEPSAAPPTMQIVSGEDQQRPLFLYVSTIEPRKNHLLLLHVWRRLAQELGPAAAPRLALVGRRGWENEQILDLLERCPALQGLVEERSDLSDADSRALLLRASAMLVPSFAEGYGLPLAEALTAGTPVICSDIPPFREVGGTVPEYLDPLDGPGWLRAVMDYADPASPRREAQLARLKEWRAPSWDRHLDLMVDFLDHGFA